jgi:Spy/CpxP family protein refolding chaperone
MKYIVAVAVFLIVGSLSAQRPEDCPLHVQHMQQMQHDKQARDDNPSAGVINRGEKGMGFSQTSTNHHFLITDDGGVIQVEVNDPQDVKGREQIRTHLQGVTKAFAAGDFRIPAFVHDQPVPGVPVLERLRSDISYEYAQTAAGGKVQISSRNPEAIAAIHDFLTFQIREHHTRDPITKPAATAQVKTLAPEQVQSLLGGEGMGMAKAAELNHYPGPRHVLDLASALQLSKDQTAQSQAIYDEMHQKAVALGGQIIQQERALDQLFELREVSPERVRTLVAEIALLQGQLRSVHLLAHVAEKQVLSPEQVMRYVELRTNPGPKDHSHGHNGQ